MLSPRNVIYGFCLFTNPQKNKYLISLYKGLDLEIIACFSTSQQRHIAYQQGAAHGQFKNSRNEVVAYIFNPGNVVGEKPDGTLFSFPIKTIIPFDYCFQNKTQEELINGFQSPQICFVLSKEEYIEVIYAMYKSKLTPPKFKKKFEEILSVLCK